ncbi:hypothetical protein SARC_06001 [Sphaeroforma arctica JP610]|uniref:Chitin-binding type-4 domain-containing protein n=1 Tax=Sphaeroforma arctica JP610 TaxID=667725 RepID=A0A0L0FYQ8_9EUKA|nr:hypothetical protein SARC_06001 [Sphaeroforma arctica JP610]KNC81691.1 hypothetical protein SARC_06001 [Sphaeroforma arctica JP610]|eukprot:XP_014155593.1 hypothetical protein SARC_06001 [Sphaeroforma arctica JP610]
MQVYNAGVNAHGYLSKPQARNVPNNEDRQSLSAGGPHSVLSGGKYCHGLCGDKWDADQKWNVPGPIQATYQEGESIDLEVTVTAHHLGWFDFQLCDSPDITEECFQRNKLKRATCDNDCDLWWKPLSKSETMSQVVTANGGYSYDTVPSGTVTFKARFKLPSSVDCTHCVLRWHWFTANSCPAKNPSKDESKISEEFWNCADIRINARSGSTRNTDPSKGLANTLRSRKGENLIPKGYNNYCPKRPHGKPSDFTVNKQCFASGRSSCSY